MVEVIDETTVDTVWEQTVGNELIIGCKEVKAPQNGISPRMVSELLDLIAQNPEFVLSACLKNASLKKWIAELADEQTFFVFGSAFGGSQGFQRKAKDGRYINTQATKNKHLIFAGFARYDANDGWVFPKGACYSNRAVLQSMKDQHIPAITLNNPRVFPLDSKEMVDFTRTALGNVDLHALKTVVTDLMQIMSSEELKSTRGNNEILRMGSMLCGRSLIHVGLFAGSSYIEDRLSLRMRALVASFRGTMAPFEEIYRGIYASNIEQVVADRGSAKRIKINMEFLKLVPYNLEDFSDFDEIQLLKDGTAWCKESTDSNVRRRAFDTQFQEFIRDLRSRLDDQAGNQRLRVFNSLITSFMKEKTRINDAVMLDLEDVISIVNDLHRVIKNAVPLISTILGIDIMEKWTTVVFYVVYEGMITFKHEQRRETKGLLVNCMNLFVQMFKDDTAPENIKSINRENLAEMLNFYRETLRAKVKEEGDPGKIERYERVLRGLNWVNAHIDSLSDTVKAEFFKSPIIYHPISGAIKVLEKQHENFKEDVAGFITTIIAQSFFSPNAEEEPMVHDMAVEHYKIKPYGKKYLNRVLTTIKSKVAVFIVGARKEPLYFFAYAALNIHAVTLLVKAKLQNIFDTHNMSWGARLASPDEKLKENGISFGVIYATLKMGYDQLVNIRFFDIPKDAQFSGANLEELAKTVKFTPANHIWGYPFPVESQFVDLSRIQNRAVGLLAKVGPNQYLTKHTNSIIGQTSDMIEFKFAYEWRVPLTKVEDEQCYVRDVNDIPRNLPCIVLKRAEEIQEALQLEMGQMSADEFRAHMALLPDGWELHHIAINYIHDVALASLVYLDVMDVDDIPVAKHCPKTFAAAMGRFADNETAMTKIINNLLGRVGDPPFLQVRINPTYKCVFMCMCMMIPKFYYQGRVMTTVPTFVIDTTNSKLVINPKNKVSDLDMFPDV